MSQRMQKSPKSPMDIQPFLRAENDDPLAQADTLKIISCPICQAIYIPSSQQEAAAPGQAPVLLETAFLSLCRFCFRCQRPSCPQCWNPVHHVCASCSEEARLPFRSPVPSLEGLIFSSQVSTQTAQVVPLSFTCLRNGRFYSPEPASQYGPSPLSSYPNTSTDLPVVQVNHRSSAPAYPPAPWIQEMGGRKPVAQMSQPLFSRPRGNASTAWPTQPGPTTAGTHTNQPFWTQMVHALPPIPALPPLRTDDRVNKDQSEDNDTTSMFERIENVLIVVISVLLFTIVLMIVLAMSSAPLNTFFFRLLHIDIRSEILYLLQLR